MGPGSPEHSKTEYRRLDAILVKSRDNALPYSHGSGFEEKSRHCHSMNAPIGTSSEQQAYSEREILLLKEDSFDITKSQDSVASINQKSAGGGTSTQRLPPKKSAFANMGDYGVSLGEESEDSNNFENFGSQPTPGLKSGKLLEEDHYLGEVMDSQRRNSSLRNEAILPRLTEHEDDCMQEFS